MPKQFKNQQAKTDSRRKVDTYHHELMYMVKAPSHWPRGGIELQEFLDQDNNLLPEPAEFEDLRELWESVRCAGIMINLHQNLNSHNLKVFARKLFASEIRCRYYRQIINSRLNCASKEEVKPVPVIELEQRYQYYLYKKDRKHRGLGQGPSFKKWLTEADQSIKNPFS